MKKRIACILMTLIMLVSLVPAAALTASAASMSTSEAAITVLKKMTQFHDTCYQVANTQEFRIGYGTVCEEKHNINAEGKPVDKNGNTEDAAGDPIKVETHTIGQTDADKALRAALQEMDKKVNSFASSNGLTLSQSQHDALVIFSYNSGTAWMDGNGVVKTAIVNGAGTNELLNAMNLWTKNADPGRRKIEVNMYVNDVYSNVVPTSFVSVTYDANGGTMAQGNTYTMLFDKTVTVSHTPTPTKSGSTFLGWYIDGNVWAPSLTADCAGKTLKAHWQPLGQKAAADAGAEASYTLNKSQLASKTIYNWPDLEAESCKSVGTVSDKVSVIRDYIGTDGTRWAKIGTDKWVIVKAGSNGISSGNTDIDVTVTVTNSYVNSRVNATIHSATNGSYSQGTQLRIINTDQADGFLWGQVAKSADDDTPICWVALMYTNWNSVKDQQNAADSSENTEAIAKATVTATGYLNVRSDAGTDNKIVGALAKNETVDVYEIKTVNGHQWGRTNSGWFCMTYTSVTMLGDNSNKIISDEGALAYAFTGKTTMELKPHVQPGNETNTTGDTLQANTSVTLTNMVVTGTEGTWGKIVWRVDTNKDGKLDSNKTGWVSITELSNAATASPIKMDAARFQVISDTKVRKTYDNAADSLFTITKGVEFEAVEIKLVGENIWGLTSEIKFVKDSDTLSGDGYNGWVNLSNKYVTRMNAPTIEGSETTSPTGKVATVINTDSVRVRDYGATYGNVTGSLARGVTVTVWDGPNDNGWYLIDTNQNGVWDKGEKDVWDGWVYGDYLSIADASSDDTAENNNSSNTTRTTGTGIVANTYAGVNVRSGAGIGNPAVGKLLPGTVVNILETKTAGNATWGRVSQGWVCMDYITMISYDEIPNGSTGNSGNGTAVDDLDKVDKTTTTAVYTGKISSEVTTVNVYAAPALKSGTLNGKEVVRVLNAGDPITMYELLAVKETYEETDTDEKKNESDPDDKTGGGTTTTTTVTSYWARVNDGYIYNPEANITLDALDEAVHTLTGSDTLNVRKSAGTDSEAIDKLEKGDQVQVTSLEIDNDKVWGRIETANDGYGWIRLDYMSEGAYYVQETSTAPTLNTPAPTIGSTGNTGTGGFVNNSSGYKYTGTVIRNGTTTLKVRATPSPSAKITTELNNGASLVIYETTIADGMAWGRCDAGWVYLYYVDLTPSSGSAIDAKIVYTENAIVYTDSSCSGVAGTYSRMSLVDIYEVVGNMARTDLGWINTNDIA